MEQLHRSAQDYLPKFYARPIQYLLSHENSPVESRSIRQPTSFVQARQIRRLQLITRTYMPFTQLVHLYIEQIINGDSHENES